MMKLLLPKTIIATRENDPRMLVECLDQGADVDARGPFGETALHWAAMLGRETMAELLLEKGANPSTVDYSGRTPMEFARSCRKHRVGVVLDKWHDDKQRQR